MRPRRKIAAAKAAASRRPPAADRWRSRLAQGRLIEFLDLCGELGFDRVEYGESLATSKLDAQTMIGLASERGLDVQFELGRKQGARSAHAEAAELVEEGRAWLDGGAVATVIEARESAENVGLFDAGGSLTRTWRPVAEGLGLERVVFEAPTKPSQFALLEHLGPTIRLSATCASRSCSGSRSTGAGCTPTPMRSACARIPIRRCFAELSKGVVTIGCFHEHLAEQRQGARSSPWTCSARRRPR